MANLRSLLAAGVMTGGLAASASGASPTLTVRVDNRTPLPERTLAAAESVAGGIFRRGGISIDWMREPIEKAGVALTIVIAPTVTAHDAPVADDVMGLTANADGVRSRVAYVFYDRVTQFSDGGRAGLPAVLGSVIAHELGHLLLPIHAHSTDGIMRGHWDRTFIPRPDAGGLNFMPAQARLLRARLASLETITAAAEQIDDAPHEEGPALFLPEGAGGPR